MDNMSCLEFLMLIYNWILDDIEEQNQPQPVYIEMQPLAPRIYPAERPDVPLIRQRKHVCSESIEIPVIEPIKESEPTAEPPEPEPTPTATNQDIFVTDFEIIEIADLTKED